MLVVAEMERRLSLLSDERAVLKAFPLWPEPKVGCSVLRCVAVCCGVLQGVAGLSSCARAQGVLRCVAVCCGVLQCVAVCCSVLQCVAVCCSVLQCVAVCCCVLWCAIMH